MLSKTTTRLGQVFRVGVFYSRAGAEALQQRLEQLSGPAWIVEYAGGYAVESDRPPPGKDDIAHVPVGSTVNAGMRAICVRWQDAQLEAKRIQDDERIGACYDDRGNLSWYAKVTGNPVLRSDPPRCSGGARVSDGGGG